MDIYLRKVFVLGLLLLLILSPMTLRAAEPVTENNPALEPADPTAGEDLGYGFGSVVASLLYSPLKVTYAGLGLFTGGLGYVLSAGRMDVADNIIYPAVTGDYVITPTHLKGGEPVIFIGDPGPEEPRPQELSSLAPLP